MTKNLFAGRQVLVVEDDYWAVAELVPRLQAAGADIVGPVPTVEQGLRKIEGSPNLFGAILDISLHGETVFPLADALARRNVPFVFVSSYERQFVPPRFADAALLPKPFDFHSIPKAFASLTEIKVVQAVNPLNRLIAGLAPADRAVMKALLQRVSLPKGTVLERHHQNIKDAYFIECGVASMIAAASPCHKIEIGVIGREGMTGTGLVQGDSQSPFQLVMQVDGWGQKIDANDLIEATNAIPAFASIAKRYARTLSIQIASTAVANGRYKVEQRLARWLAMMDDRLTDHEISLTHDYLAMMLGVRRPSVTVGLHILEGEGFIRSLRGKIIVKNRPALIAFSEGAYGFAEAEYERLMGFPL